MKRAAMLLSVVVAVVCPDWAGGQFASAPPERGKVDRHDVLPKHDAPKNPKAASPAPTPLAKARDVAVRGVVEWDRLPRMDFGKSLPSDMLVFILLKGKPAAEAISYGHIQLKAVIDASGKRLSLARNRGVRDATTEYVRISRSEHDLSPHPKGGVRVPLHFDYNATKAKKLSVVEGTLKLRTGGTTRVIVLDKLASRADKPVEDAALKAAGLTARLAIKPYDPGGWRIGTTVALSVEGDYDAIVDTEVVNARGNSLWFGGGRFLANRRASFEVIVKGDLPDDARLRVTLRLNAGEVEIPFRLTDLAIPPVPVEPDF
ncbi:MAG: hypothetical protein JW818_04605 [Pirellulales bacterium]|nr:hypothetical protein [Pirellulales bacterium]